MKGNEIDPCFSLWIDFSGIAYVKLNVITLQKNDKILMESMDMNIGYELVVSTI